MVNSKSINATEGRLKQTLGGFVDGVVESKGYDTKIINAVNDAKIRTGIVTKYYHYLDKAQVKLDNSNKKVVCKMLHRFGGELMDYYTPLADRVVYCEKLKEPCVIPREKLHCVVLNIHDEDSNEWLLLGFYQNRDLVGVNPAQPGNFKIVTRGAVNQYWIKFGIDGMDLRLPENVKKNVGEYDRDMEEIIPVDSSEYYTKEAVDELLKSYDNRIKQLEDTILQLNGTNPDSGATGATSTENGTSGGA